MFLSCPWTPRAISQSVFQFPRPQVWRQICREAVHHFARFHSVEKTRVRKSLCCCTLFFSSYCAGPTPKVCRCFKVWVVIFVFIAGLLLPVWLVLERQLWSLLYKNVHTWQKSSMPASFLSPQKTNSEYLEKMWLLEMFPFSHHHSLSNNNLKDAVIRNIADAVFTSGSTLDLVTWVNADYKKYSLFCACLCVHWNVSLSYRATLNLRRFHSRALYLLPTRRLDQNNTTLKAVEYLIQKLSTCSNIKDVHVEYVWTHSLTVTCQ